MLSYPSVTGYIKRTSAMIAHFLLFQVQNEHTIASSVLALPAPKNATAATWDRERHVCPICQREMTKNFTGMGADYFCLPCDHLAAEEARKQLETARRPAIKLPTGSLNRLYRQATAPAGAYARDMHHASQEKALRAAWSSFSTIKCETPEAAMLNPQHPLTEPLAARDIEYASTPPIKQIPISALPPLRADLFHDADIAACMAMEESTPLRDTDEHDTLHVPTYGAELLLRQMARNKPVEQETGENERLPAKSAAWML